MASEDKDQGKKQAQADPNKNKQNDSELGSASIKPKTINEDDQDQDNKQPQGQKGQSGKTKQAGPGQQNQKPSSPQQPDRSSQKSPQDTQNKESQDNTPADPKVKAAPTDQPETTDNEALSTEIKKTDSIPQQGQPASSNLNKVKETTKDDPLPKVEAKKPSGAKYTIVLSILGIFALAGLAFAGYQFYQSRIADTQEDNDTVQQNDGSGVATPEINLENGNVVSTSSDGQQNILIDKTSFDTTGIAGFTDIKNSPDGSMFCFHTKPPAPVSAIYLSDMSGENVQEVGRSRTNCHWLGDSSSIVYENMADVGLPINIYMYDIQTQEETVLTSGAPDDPVRFYSIEGIAENGTTVLCSFETETDEQATPCSIDTQTQPISVSVDNTE